MKVLLENLDEFKEKLNYPLFIMSDYDGTLTPIIENPENSKLSRDMRGVLSKLSELCPLAIVSGRSLEDIKARVGINDIYYVGNHGIEITGPDIDFIKSEAEKNIQVIDKICEDIEERIGYRTGLIIENKKFTASIHYRSLEENDISRVKEVILDSARPYIVNGVVKVLHGKKIFEVRPDINWDKGKAVSWLLKSTGFGEKSYPLYLGDDETDEDAFRSLKENGVSALVSRTFRESNADYLLRNVKEVKIFLKYLIKII